MARDLVNTTGYMPLFAGADVVRKRQLEFRLPTDNVPGVPVPTFVYLDEFSDEGQNLLEHQADISPNLDKGYDASNSGMIMTDGVLRDVFGGFSNFDSRTFDAPTRGKYHVEFVGPTTTDYDTGQTATFGYRDFPIGGFSGGTVQLNYNYTDGKVYVYVPQVGNAGLTAQLTYTPALVTTFDVYYATDGSLDEVWMNGVYMGSGLGVTGNTNLHRISGRAGAGGAGISQIYLDLSDGP